MSYAIRLKRLLEQVGTLRVSWMKEKPGGPTIATIAGSNHGSEYITDVASESLRAAHHIVHLCEAHDRVLMARDELKRAEQSLAEIFKDLENDRSGA